MGRQLHPAVRNENASHCSRVMPKRDANRSAVRPIER